MLSEDLKCFTGNECKELDQCPRGCFCSSDDRNCRSCHQAVEDCRLIPCPQGCECDEKTYRCEGWTDEDDPRMITPEVYRSRRDILREDTDAYLQVMVALRLPKETQEQKASRTTAIEESMKRSARRRVSKS